MVPTLQRRVHVLAATSTDSQTATPRRARRLPLGRPGLRPTLAAAFALAGLAGWVAGGRIAARAGGTAPDA
jgi:hypothetical protein